MFFFRRRKRKVGLALGSGAARGLAHIGTINALQEQGVKIDMIAGASIGALVGACFAANNLKGLETKALKMDLKNLLKLADLNFILLSKGFISGKKVEDFLRSIIGDVEFRDLNIPLVVTATDVQTGEEVIIKDGPVVKAVRASLSIPAVFTPAKFDGKFLIDAGVASPMPVDILKRQGMDFIIASNVVKKPKVSAGSNSRGNFISTKKIISYFKGSKKIESIEKDDLPFMLETIVAAIDIMGYQIVKLKLKEADVVISPEVAHIALLEFYRAKEAVDAGYIKARENILKYRLNKRLGNFSKKAGRL